MVEIESHWTATRRENQGIYPTVRRRDCLHAPPRFAIGRATAPCFAANVESQRSSMMYKRSRDGNKTVKVPANLAFDRARITGSPTSLASPYSKRQPAKTVKQWSPLSATKVSWPASSRPSARQVSRILTELSRKMKVIRKRVCSERYLDMSKCACSDEIMAANLLLDCRGPCKNG